jgi:hypothetical protein
VQEVLFLPAEKKNEKRRQTQLLLVQMKMYPFVTSFQEEEKGRKPLCFVMQQLKLAGDEQPQAAGRGTNLRNIRYPVDTSLVLGVVFGTSEGV